MTGKTGFVEGIGIKGRIEQRVIQTSHLGKNRALDRCPGILEIFSSPSGGGTKNYGGVDYKVAEYNQTDVDEDDYSHRKRKVHVEVMYMPNLERLVLFGRSSTDSSKLQEVQPDDDIPTDWRRDFSSSHHTYGPCEVPYNIPCRVEYLKPS